MKEVKANKHMLIGHTYEVNHKRVKLIMVGKEGMLFSTEITGVSTDEYTNSYFRIDWDKVPEELEIALLQQIAYETKPEAVNIKELEMIRWV